MLGIRAGRGGALRRRIKISPDDVGRFLIMELQQPLGLHGIPVEHGSEDTRMLIIDLAHAKALRIESARYR